MRFFGEHTNIFMEQIQTSNTKCLWTHQLKCWYSLFKITCILKKLVDRYTYQGFWEDVACSRLFFYFYIHFWCLTINTQNIHVLTILNTMDVVACFTIMPLLWYCTWRSPPPNVSSVPVGGVTIHMEGSICPYY